MATKRTRFDTIIIGAGLAGLTAAHEIYRDRPLHNILVLEARGRVGGKTWSISPHNNGQVVDVGAAWINDTNQSEVYALARSLSLKLVVQNTNGHIIQEDLGGGLSTFTYGSAPDASLINEPGGVSEMLRIRQLWEDECQRIDIRNSTSSITARKLDGMSVRDWVIRNSSSKTALASVSVWTRAMLGLEPEEVSTLHFLDYCKSGGGLLQMRMDTQGGGQYLRFIDGAQSLSKGLAKRLGTRVKLDVRVTEILQEEGTCTVTTASGEKHSSKNVIVTLPTPLYTTIQFSPPLPIQKQALAQSTIQGYTNKVMLLYRTPWWRNAGLCGLIQSFAGPITVSRDSSVDETGQYSLTCFLVGTFGRELSLLSQKDRFDRVEAHVEKVFGPVCQKYDVRVEQPIAFTECEWAKDDLSGGCPVPVFPPGKMLEHEQDLRTRFGNVFFAGTETSFEWKGYMDGAIRSGKRVARELLEESRKAKL